MKIFSRVFFILIVFVFLISEGCVRQKPLNLILFIGDGMGVSQVYAAMTVSGNNMVFPSFPVTGFSITHSANSYLTDSAAGGTALATGEKTNNRMISMRPDSTDIKTLFEYAKDKGMSTGIVCTSSLTDATPATFVSHVPVRYDYRNIARQYLGGDADIFIGGGRSIFAGTNDSISPAESREDLTSLLKEKGYDITFSLEEFVNSESGHIAGFMSPKDLPRIFEGRDTLYLSEATSKAISVLSKNRKGFILMVEGSEIDDAGHDNDARMVTDEVLDLDRAVKVAKDFAIRDGKTLIVVTADHETGGMSIIGGDRVKKEVKCAFTTGGHSGVMVPVFAFGPGASEFSGIHENTGLFYDFCKLLSLDN